MSRKRALYRTIMQFVFVLSWIVGAVVLVVLDSLGVDGRLSFLSLLGVVMGVGVLWWRFGGWVYDRL